MYLAPVFPLVFALAASSMLISTIFIHSGKKKLVPTVDQEEHNGQERQSSSGNSCLRAVILYVRSLNSCFINRCYTEH